MAPRSSLKFSPEEANQLSTDFQIIASGQAIKRETESNTETETHRHVDMYSRKC